MVIISFKKQRKIDLSNISLTGSITSIKNNSIVEFESSLERDFIFLLEYDVNVLKYYEQPIKINYFEKNEAKIYIPDFFVEYQDGKSSLIEIKYKKDLEENECIYLNKFESAEKFCKKNNFEFVILSEDKIRTDLLFNAKFLVYYQNPLIKLDHNYVRIIHKTVKKFHKISAIELINEISGDEEKKAELIYVLWYMVANHILSYDKNCKLTMKSLIWVNKL